MPYQCANKPFRPANGTDGQIFESMYCEHCKNYVYDENMGQDDCPILTAAWCFDIEDEAYPKEWVYNSVGKPICTAFEGKAGK